MRAGARPPDARPLDRARRSRKRVALRRLLFVAALAALLLAAIWAANTLAAHRTTSRPGAPATPQAQPFSSAFVQAGAPWSPVVTHALAHDAAAIFGDGTFPQTTSVVIESARTGAVLYSLNAGGSLVPASALKLVVAATALADLGPQFRFTTRFVTDQALQADTLTGSLWLAGGGDPELTSADLMRAVASLKALGIRHIMGDVVADGSLFGPDSVNPAWQADDLEFGYAALTSAVTMDGGTAQFTITPDTDGGAAEVRVDPDQIADPIDGIIRTTGADGENTLRIDPVPGGDGFRVSGQIPYGAPQKYWRSISHPTLRAASALRAMLVHAGIAVDGGASIGPSPTGAHVLWTRQSRPLAAIIRRMDYDSDNHIAEQLLRAVGAARFGTGSLENGLAAEREFMHGIGADQSGLILADGSGLSTADRISARAEASVLRHLLSGSDSATVAALLPRVGVDGTVHVRSVASDVRGRILGKDGYIEGVSSLAGYVKSAHHGVVIYAFVVNGWQRGLDAVWAGEDDLLTRIAKL
jgi:D-alanyl-D-alanine carboxypeptidase/D-alanyl-D-alanine-endopeptidase (penicillin-binding protein 4)